MKTMLFYELKKMFSFRKTLVCAVSAAAVCAIVFFASASSHNLFENLSDIEQEMNAAAEKMTNEHTEETRKRYEEIISDPNNYIEEDGEKIFAPSPEIKEEMDSFEDILYKNMISNYSERILWNLQEELAGSDISRNEELLIKQNIEMVSRKGSFIAGYNLFYDYYNSFVKSYAPLLLGFLILFFTAPVFSNEYAVKMDGLILSSKRGKRGVIIAKFAAALIGVSGLYILVMGVYILISGAVLGFSGGQTSLAATAYDVYQYIESPYDFTMLQFLWFSLASAWAACIGFAIFTLFISSLIRNTLAVFAVSFAAFYMPLLYCGAAGRRESLRGVINFSYSRIMQTAPLIDVFDGFVLFGRVIMIKEAALFMLAAVSLILGLLAYRSFRRRQAAN